MRPSASATTEKVEANMVLEEPGKARLPQRNPIALAEEWQRWLADGDVRSKADLARTLGVSRARVTQVLDLLRLAPKLSTR